MSTRARRVRLVGPGSKTRGGIAQFTTQLARVLRDHDGALDVAVLGFRRVYPRFSRAGRQGLDPSERQESVDSYAILVPWLPWTWISAWKRAPLGPGDLLVVQWWHPITAGCSWYLARRARKSGARVVFICHNAAPHESFPLSASLSRLALRQSSLFIALSDPVAEELRELVPGVDVRVLAHPPYSVLDPDPQNLAAGSERWRSRLGISGTAKVVLFFGNVRSYKGLADLIEAFPAVHRQTEAVLVAVGTFFEPLSAHLERVRALGLAGCVRLVNEYVPNEDVAPLFALADVIALPYRSASQSGVLPIAAVVGRPVVATNVGGLPDALGGRGLLVPPRNPQALSEALTRALQQPPAPPPMPGANWSAWVAMVEGEGECDG